ncbi:DNA repair protein rad5 [Pyrenophora teres f. maculata]|nr:DNA repair protein rad5 [Pyrenophora teres f. maculata]
MDPQGSALSVQATIDLIQDVLPGIDHADRPYYERRLNELYKKLHNQSHAVSVSESSAMAGAYHHHQPTHGNYMASMYAPPPPPPSYTTPSYGTHVPSPPYAEPASSRKRSLGPVDYPEAKRVSGHPSPVTPTSPIRSWSYSLPNRQSQPSRQSGPIPIVDLTESGPPTPDFFEIPTQVLSDPFAELDIAFRQNGSFVPSYGFNQAFMQQDELAAFMTAPTPPSVGYEYLQQPAPDYFSDRQIPYHRRLGGGYEDRGAPVSLITESEAIEKLLENIQEDDGAIQEREPTPANMTCSLKEYQRIGLTWLLKMERGTTKGGILADEMGLGKTIQALALICRNPPSDPAIKTTLIIAPVALMRQWEKEIERHVHPRHKLSVHLYHGTGKNVDFAHLRKFDVVLTTFGCLTSEYKQKESSKESMLHDQERLNPSLRRKPKDKLGLLGHECMWYRVIIDEAHNIKNRNAKSSKACADLMAKHRLCLTGTPMMNNIDELFGLIRFLKVEPYCDWHKFNMEIVKPMKNLSQSTKKGGVQRVQILLRSIMLRRQKSSLVDGKPISVIPPKHVAVDNVKFEEEEYAIYKALEDKSQIFINKYLERGRGSTTNYASVLVVLLRLRQACCHPHLIKDLSQPATDGIAEADLLGRAKELHYDVIVRLKEHDSFECPICMEADPNPTIIVPCGHTVCGECVQKLIDPAMRAAQQDGNDETTTPKCPHCRGELKAKLITDYKHFLRAHCPERLDPEDLEEEEVSDEDADSEIDSEDDDDSAPDVDKKGNLAGFVVDDDEDDEDENDDDSAPETKVKSKSKKPKKSSKDRKGKGRAKPKLSLAQLKKESLRSKAAKKRYMRRLDKTYIPSAKINRTIELLNEIRVNDPTEKTLIFSQFTSLLDLVEVPLWREGIKYQRYDGSMKMDDRAEAVNLFMDNPNQNVMLVSIKAGNAGLNLWKASQVIILDPFWNPFIEEQAVDRAHRMPQTREVYVHRILVPDTVEDRIVMLQDKKREIIGDALDENASKRLTRLGPQELRYLFGMG